jgi:hypothetical protein
MSEAKRAYEKADGMVFDVARRSEARIAFESALSLAAASATAEDRYYRRACEERILELDATSSDEGVRAAARAFCIECVTRRLRTGTGEEHELFGLAILLQPLGIDALPAELRDEFRGAWAAQRLDVLATWSSSVDKRVDARWRLDVVPDDANEAYLWARESYRRAEWRHAASCAQAAQRGTMQEGRAASARLFELAALHRAHTSDAQRVRATIVEWVATKKPRGKHARWLMAWDRLAALAIVHDIGRADGDDELLASLVKAWSKAEPRFAVPALFASPAPWASRDQAVRRS